MKPIAWNAKLWQESVTQLHEFLSPLIAGLGRSERRVAAARYVEGLLMPGQRKSMIPIYPDRLLTRQKNFGCDVGTDSPHDSALAGEMERTLSLLRDEVRPNLQRRDLT